MITVRIQIGNGDILDTREYGLTYVSADNRTEAPVKRYDSSSYAEQAGENPDPRTVQDAFDYKVKFLIEAPNKDLHNANSVIAAFNRALYESGRGDIRKFKTVTFYNDYKRVKIVGIPKPMAQPEKLYRRQDGGAMDCVLTELTIRVSDPSKCDFDLRTDV